MELFKVRNGPWTKMFEGTFQSHKIEVHSNPSKTLMVLVYEEKEPLEGVVIEFYKVYSAEGAVEEFVESLPKEAILLEKHSADSTIKYFMLSSEPHFVSYTEETFMKETDDLLDQIEATANSLKQISVAYDVNFQELEKMPEEVKSAFFTQTLLTPILASNVKPVKTSVSPTAQKIPVATTEKNMAFLGLDKNSEQTRISVESLRKSLVSEGNPNDRLRALQVLIEEILLSNVPVVIFDWENKFAGLNQPNKDNSEFKKYQIGTEPIGFPVKHFKTGEEISIDMNLVSMPAILEEFGLKDEKLLLVLEEAIKLGQVSNLEELISQVKKIPTTDKITAYAIQRAVRLLKLIDLRYPKLFDGGNDIAEISKKGVQALGRAGVIHLDSVDARISRLISHSLIKGIIEHYREEGKKIELQSMLVIPDSEKIIGASQENLISNELRELLKDFISYGGGFLLSSEKEIDLPKDFYQTIDSRINIVTNNDVGIQLKDKKRYRTLIRPTLSTIS